MQLQLVSFSRWIGQDMPVAPELLRVSPCRPVLSLDIGRGLGYASISLFTSIVSHRRAHIAIDNGVVVDGDEQADRERVRHFGFLLLFRLAGVAPLLPF